MSESGTNSNNGKSAQPAAAGNEAAPKLELQKVYIRDVSLETPNSPQVFTDQWKPEHKIEIHSNAKPLSEQVYDVGLTLTLTAKQGEQVGYLIELTQAGVFTLSGFPRPQLGHMLGAYCPTVLFPYARETIDGLLVKAGFPPVHLAPINFDALYQQHAKSQSSQTPAAPDQTA